MSIPDSDTSNSRVKTLGIRFEPDIHADMTLIASLRGTSFQAEVLEACRSHVATVKASPELAARADDALADIEREAAARRESFARLFGSTPDSNTVPTLPISTEIAQADKPAANPAPATSSPKEARSRRASGTSGS